MTCHPLLVSGVRSRGPLESPQRSEARQSRAARQGPRAARREAVPLDGRAQRSYPHQPGPPSTLSVRLINPACSIKDSETPHPRSGSPTQR